VLAWWDASSTRAIRNSNLAWYLGDGGLAPSAAVVLDRFFEQLIISLDVDRSPNGIGSARVARVFLLNPCDPPVREWWHFFSSADLVVSA
jgi:hypothetical protein